MHLFTRRRKESAQQQQHLPAIPPKSPLGASLPASYKQDRRTTGVGSHKLVSDSAGLPALPVGKENAAPLQGHGHHGGRNHHATAPPAGNFHSGQPGIVGELGQMMYTPTSNNHTNTQQHASTYTAPGRAANGHSGALSGGGYHQQQTLPAIPRDPSSKRNLNTKGLPLDSSRNVANRRMSTGSIPSVEARLVPRNSSDQAELQLCYGYWPIETHRELNLVQIEEIVRLCGQEIRARGIEAPLLFSTQALDISMEGICSLIRSYLSNRELWRKDLRFASPHDLCGMIKWALGRHVNPQGARGFLAWEMYERWRFGEREKDFPPRYLTTHMLYLLPTQNSALLTTLFSLMSSALAYTSKNGCTVRKLATLFSAYIFGLPDDGTFEHTYTAFNRFSHATEHLLLAFLRDQIHQLEVSGAPTSTPVRLREAIKDYLLCLPTNLNKPPAGAEMQPVVRIRRHVRWYSKNLVASAGTWQVPRSKHWAMIAPLPSLLPEAEGENKTPPFAYTARYKHLLNIGNLADEEDEEDMQKFSSIVQKEWKSFMMSGFAPPDASKLKFDLTESDRANRRRKHETIDWTTFESSGFHGRETFLDVDLNFNPGVNDPFNQEDVLSEAHAKVVAERARNVEKSLPPFNHDITPHEERSIQIDKQFLEVYSDVLCASGWTREEMKESSWALVQFRTRPRDGERPRSAGTDGRTSETWFLVEELVPPEYRASLLEQAQAKPKTSRRISFLRPVRRKQSKQPAMPEISNPLGIFNRSVEQVNRSKASLPYTPFRQTTTHQRRSGSPNMSLKTPDDAVFVSGPTKMLKLSKSISSTGFSKASSLHEDETEALDAPPVIVQKDEIGRSNAHAGIGYTKPGQGAGSTFMDMVRKTTRRKRHSFAETSTGFGNPSSRMAEPSSPASTVVPGSPGFNLAEHGVSGPGQAIDSPREWMDRMARMSDGPDQQRTRYQRSPASYSGTHRSSETRGTNGHSESGTINPAPRPFEVDARRPGTGGSHTASETRDSASMYDRDLPVRPVSDHGDRPFSSATRDAEELVEAYSQPRIADMSINSSEEDPYDGIADDEETVEASEIREEAPLATNAQMESQPEVPEKPLPVKEQTSPTLFIKPLRVTSLSGQAKDDKPLPRPDGLDDTRERVNRPLIPVNGTGRVNQLAGRFGGSSPTSP